MSSDFRPVHSFDKIFNKMESRYKKYGNLDGMRIEILPSDDEQIANIRIYGENLTNQDVHQLMQQIAQNQNNNAIELSTSFCDRLTKVINDPQSVNTNRNISFIQDIVNSTQKTLASEKKNQRFKEIEELCQVIKAYTTNNTGVKESTIQFYSQFLEGLAEKIEELKQKVTDPSCSVAKFSVEATKIYFELLQKIVVFDDRYKPILIDKLIESSTDENELYSLPPLGNNAVKYAIEFNDIHALNKIYEKFPQSMSKFMNSRSGILHPLATALLINRDREEIVKKLVEYGANINFIEPGGEPILNSCIFSKSVNAKSRVDCCLSIPETNVNFNDLYGRKILHNIAIKPPRDDVVESLLGDDRIRDQKNEKDAYGYTPIDYAYFHKNDRLITALSETGTVDKTDPRYGKEPLKIAQGKVRENVDKYLQFAIEDHDAKNELIDTIMVRSAVRSGEGFCNGLTFLFFYYHSKGKEEMFYEILRELSQWDGNVETLATPFEASRFNGLYRNLGDLFEQTINDIVWFQSSYPIGGQIEDPQRQKMREFLYNTVKNPEKDRELEHVMDLMEFRVNKEQLAELLDLIAPMPGLMIDLSGGSHSTGLITLPGGRAKYYDPNEDYEIKELENSKEAAEIIENFKYKLIEKLGYVTSNENEMGYVGYMELAFQMFRLDLSEERPRPAPSIDMAPLLARKSPNGFTPLHLAVLCNDKERLTEILSVADADVNAKDLHKKTALEYAFMLNRTDLAVELLKNPDADLSSIYLHFLSNPTVTVIKFQNEELMRTLLAHPKFMDTYTQHLLEKAVEANVAALVEAILQSGRTIEGPLSPLNTSIENHQIEITRLLLKNGQLPTDEFYEWIRERIETEPVVVESLLSAMPNINIEIQNRTETLFGRATKDSNDKLVELLTRLGAGNS